MTIVSLPSPLPLPPLLAGSLDAALRRLLEPDGGPRVDFTAPPGEPALVEADSISWRIFKNPVSLYVGGIAAVILELAEPSVRTGVWEHSSFRRDPATRLQRTGLAAMVTVYGARSVAQEMIARIVRLHDKVAGETPDGTPYRANDVELLTWVHATAGFGFAEAYHAYVGPLTRAERDRLCREGLAAAELYGAADAPASIAELRALFERLHGRLEASPIIFDFLDLMVRSPILPAPLRPLQKTLARAAVSITPGWLRRRLGLGVEWQLRPWEQPLVRSAGALSDRIMLASSPAVRSCIRLGLPADHLYRLGRAP